LALIVRIQLDLDGSGNFLYSTLSPLHGFFFVLQALNEP
jgi:hypothetical protein